MAQKKSIRPRSSLTQVYIDAHTPHSRQPHLNALAFALKKRLLSLPRLSANKNTIKPPALRFQPIRRPVAKQRPKPTFPKAIPGAKSASSAPVSAIPLSGSPAGGPRSAASGGSHTPSTAPIQPSHKSTLADWAAKEEDEWRYGASEKRQRGGRKKKKKREEERETDWDELYDPTRPTNVEEYLRSDEKIREVHEWKDLLYRHRRKRESEDSEMEDEEEEEEERPRLGSMLRPFCSSKEIVRFSRVANHRSHIDRFAPPASFSFAPPPPSSPPPQPADLPDDKTGEDAYARRLAMSKGIPPPHLPPASPPPPPSTNQQDSHIISRAPVRYSQPEPAFKPDPDDARPALGFKAEEEEEEPPRPNLPGQKGFAARLMAKYGWAKGQGLGAEESGIVNPLRVQVEKRRKKADADGGGWAEPAAKARIIGGKKSRGAEDESDGAMSEVVVLRNMLDGIEDLQAEIAEGLGQEIGEECGEKVWSPPPFFFGLFPCSCLFVVCCAVLEGCDEKC